MKIYNNPNRKDNIPKLSKEKLIGKPILIYGPGKSIKRIEAVTKTGVKAGGAIYEFGAGRLRGSGRYSFSFAELIPEEEAQTIKKEWGLMKEIKIKKEKVKEALKEHDISIEKIDEIMKILGVEK